MSFAFFLGYEYDCSTFVHYIYTITTELSFIFVYYLGESIPIRLFLSGYELTPTLREINKKFSVRYFLNLVLIDEEDRRYFKQQVRIIYNNNNNSNIIYFLNAY